MIYENFKKDPKLFEYNNNINDMKPDQELSQHYNNEQKLKNLKINEEYEKNNNITEVENMKELDLKDINNSLNNSKMAYDSIKNYRKPVSLGNSINNIRIYNRNNHDNKNYYESPINENLNNKNINNIYDKRNIQPRKMNNSIKNNLNNEHDDIDEDKSTDCYENKYESEKRNVNNIDGIKFEQVNAIPRNEVCNISGDNEPFNELYINKSYILKKFDKMMDDLGLTTEGRVTLMNLPLEKKWEIFKLQKNKVNSECFNPNIDPKSNDNSPKHFINLLKKKNINPKMLTKLRFMISDDSSTWLTNFIKNGGYYYLNRNIMDNVIKDSKTSKDWVIHEHIIRCIRVFFHSRIGLETLYSDPTPLLLLTLSLFYHQLVHVKENAFLDSNYVQSIFLSSPSVLPISNRILILDMLSYLTKIETPLGWNMVIDSLHWVSLGNGYKEKYIEDINNRLMLSKEKYKQQVNTKINLKKNKKMKSFNFASLSNIHKNLLKQPSFFSTLSISQKTKSSRTFSLLQEEYQLQGYSQYQDLNISQQKINSQNSNSDITSYGSESNSTSSYDLNSSNSNLENEAQINHDQDLTYFRNRKISNSYSQNINESNLMNISSTTLSVPNLKSIDNKIQCSKEKYSYTESDLSYNKNNNINNSGNLKKDSTSNTIDSILSESTIANNSNNYLSNYSQLNDNELELKIYSKKNQYNIKRVQVNTSLLNNKDTSTAVPRFCPFIFWMKDFEDCAIEYNQLFLGNDLSSKIIYNTIANKTYRWTPTISAPKETVEKEQAINYICSNLSLIISIINNVPEETAQNRLAIIKCFRLCRIDKIFQKLSQSKNCDILTLINQCIQKDLAKNLEDFSLFIFQHKDYYNLYGSTKSIQKNKENTIVKNISRKIIQKKKKNASMNSVIDNLSLDVNKSYNNLNDTSTRCNKELSCNSIDERKNNTFSYGNYRNKIRQSNYISEDKKSINKTVTSYNSLNIEDSCETVNNDSYSSNNQLSIACKSQVFGRLHTRKSMMN